MCSFRVSPLLLSCLLLVATATEPLAPKLSGLGTLAHPITTTTNAESQAFFAQGMNLLTTSRY
mgnify:CR=1 FL=1|jgi:hypothetical protein